MKSLFTVLLLITGIAISAFSQNKLSQSRQSGLYTYLYKADGRTVEAFYKHQKLDEGMLIHPIDSFLTSTGTMPKLPAGNYIKVLAHLNELEYELIERPTARLQLLDNRKDLQFILLDENAHEINNARVFLNGKPLQYNAKAELWRSKHPKTDSSLVKIDYKGVVNYTYITQKTYKPKHRVETWLLRKTPLKYTYPVLIRTVYKIQDKYPPYRYRRYRKNRNQGDKEDGYMVFSKPKYKPSDTIRFKAFIIEGRKHKPVNIPLDVVLSENGRDFKIGQIKPWLKGSYDFSFVVHDSLQLKLDRSHSLALRKSKKTYQSGFFKLEDYELQATKFSVKEARKTHSKDQQQSLYLTATDENGLNVPDGRVEILIRSKNISSYNANRVFVPDTLWKHKIQLDPVGETRLDIPISIFPDANLNYEVEAIFLNSNNEKKQQSLLVHLRKSASLVKFEIKADSLYLSMEESVTGKPLPATLYALNAESDTISKMAIQIPTRIPNNPFVAEYRLEGNNFSSSFDPGQSSSKIHLSGNRTPDSLFLQVNNPAKIPFWYTILKGNKLFDRGRSASDFLYHKRCNTNDNIKVQLNYIWAGKPAQLTSNIQFLENQLNVSINQPLVIIPGQKANIEIVVRDAKGKPVKDADLTAYGITSKFKSEAPNVPYLGKGYIAPKQKTQLRHIIEDNPVSGALQLNWERWAKSMQLDSIEYFRFTHPNPEYRLTEPAPDSLTQLVPFLTENGNILPVHVLYIDSKPVYFNQAEQLERYSFAVEAGYHHLRFRLANKEVTIANVNIQHAKRTILSFNINNNKNVSIQAMPAIMADKEAAQLNRYMIKVSDSYFPNISKIEALGKIHLITGNTQQQKLVGPLSWDYLQYVPFNGPSVFFNFEPNYSFEFKPGLIKQKSIPEKYQFSTWLSSTRIASFNDKVLTAKEADTIWKDFIDLRCHTTVLVRNELKSIEQPGKLTIALPDSRKTTLPIIKQVLLYKQNDPGFLNMYPGNQTDLGVLQQGKYRLMLLLKNDSYVLVDSVNVKAYGSNYQVITIDKILPKDSVSSKISDILFEKALSGFYEDSKTPEQIRQTFNQKYVDESKFTNTMWGKVLDGDNEPVIGASVTIKGIIILLFFRPVDGTTL